MTKLNERVVYSMMPGETEWNEVEIGDYDSYIYTLLDIYSDEWEIHPTEEREDGAYKVMEHGAWKVEERIK